jgi:hypothetical protein
MVNYYVFLNFLKLFNKLYYFGLVQFENECQYINATMSEFLEWNQSNNKKRKSTPNPFDSFDQNDYWAYADYKYMIDLLNSDENSIEDYVSLIIKKVLKFKKIEKKF